MQTVFRQTERRSVTLEELIKAVNKEFPEASKEDYASAFQLSMRTVNFIVSKANARTAKRRPLQPRDPKIADNIKRFADQHCKGKVDIISKPRERPLFCIGGRLVA